MTDAKETAAEKKAAAAEEKAVAKEQEAAAEEAAEQAELDTVVDSAGVTRVSVTTVQDGWEPAPTEPTDEAVKAAKERNA